MGFGADGRLALVFYLPYFLFLLHVLSIYDGYLSYLGKRHHSGIMHVLAECYNISLTPNVQSLDVCA